MDSASDMELVRVYASDSSDLAFETLVNRHINLVFSVAMRHVGDQSKAEEIAQAVFVILSQKASRLRSETIVPAWLHETTRQTSISFLRSEQRRRIREQEAYMRATLDKSVEDSVWQQLAPLLDEALSRLGEKERVALVLRFFENKTANEIAQTLQINPETAQKRVARGLEKLRRIFLKRGLVTSTTVLAGVLSTSSVQAAPAGLASVVMATTGKGAVVGSQTLTLVKGGLKLMAWTKAKITAVAVAAIILTPATGIVAVKTLSWVRQARESANNSQRPIEVLQEASVRPRTNLKPLPTLSAGKVDAALRRARAKSLTLGTATQILNELGYAPGLSVGLDRSFYDRFGEKGATLFEAAAIAIGGQEQMVAGIIGIPEATDETLESSMLAGERQNLEIQLKRFGENSSIVRNQQALISTMEKDFHCRVFKIDPAVFLRNLENRRANYLVPKSADTLEILLWGLKGAGVPYPSVRLDREAGTLTMWNTSDALDIAARVILELNQPDEKSAIFLGWVQGPWVSSTAQVFEISDYQFDALTLGPSQKADDGVGEIWSLSKEEFNSVQNVLERLQVEASNKPRFQSANGAPIGMFMGSEKKNLQWNAMATVRREFSTEKTDNIVDANILVRTQGEFSNNATGDWSDAMGFTNVAIYCKLSTVSGGGVVLRAHHPTANPKNNLLILLQSSVVKP